ncbi:MAG TPA: dihydroorotate dehydrogenase electron transfer subunit [Candidatus Cloacimonadota bacterium]|nr:dihydroorotate dehydrogenase electron transfer subunit [Candidatus Cloacimonadota bacterium]
MTNYYQRAIHSREELSDSFFILWIWDDALGKQCKPGQFFEIRPMARLQNAFSTRAIPKLFKPISIYDNQGGRIGFMIKKVGGGTNALSTLKAGDMLELVGPAGNGFPLVASRKILFVSGGIGYPPLWYLQKELINHNQIYWMHGGNTQSDIFPSDESWTVDGSLGRKGMVTQGVEANLKRLGIDLVYSCGPLPMLAEVSRVTSLHNIEHYTSLEAYMACGIGVCHGCAVPIGTEARWDYLRVCKEGPVFKAEEVRWEML